MVPFIESEVLTRYKAGSGSWYLILACGHWLKWHCPTAPEKGDHFHCPECSKSRE